MDTIHSISVVATWFMTVQVGLTNSLKCTRYDNRLLNPNCVVDLKELVLWCDQSNYTKLPDASEINATPAVIKATRTLLVNDSCITRISDGDLTSFPNLEVINAGKNMITTLRSGAFSANKNLKILDLRNNLIAKVEAGAFRGISNLTKLLLDSNRLWDFPPSKDLGNLEELSLNFNKISMLQRSRMRRLEKLRILSVQGNKLSYIEDFSFRRLSSLSSLHLDRNRLSHIEENTFKGLRNLQVLTLSHNRITSWPTRYGVLLSNLQTLHLGSNRIEAFTGKHVRHLTKLQNLSLDNNVLTVFSEDVLTKLERLRYLNLSRNYLKDLPKQAFGFSCCLTLLDIGDNELSTPHVEWFQHFVARQTANGEVRMDGNPWNCSCNVIAYQSFVEKLEEQPGKRTFAEQLKISCDSPQYARHKAFDADLIEEIKSHSNCPATKTSPAPCNGSECDYLWPGRTPILVTCYGSYGDEFRRDGMKTGNVVQIITFSLVVAVLIFVGTGGICSYRKRQQEKRSGTAPPPYSRGLLDSEQDSPPESKKTKSPFPRRDDDGVFSAEKYCDNREEGEGKRRVGKNNIQRAKPQLSRPVVGGLSVWIQPTDNSRAAKKGG